MKKLIGIAFVLNVVASVNAGTTYYKIGVDEGSYSSFSGSYVNNKGELATSASTVGWAVSRDATATVTVSDMENSDFVVQKSTTLRTPTKGGDYAFAGKTLTLESDGVFMTKGGEIKGEPSSYAVPKLIAQGGVLRINSAAAIHTFTGSISIDENSSLEVHLNADGQRAIINSSVSGNSTTKLSIRTAAKVGATGQVLELSDADGFYGTIEAVASCSSEPFTLKLTGGLGGTITSLPPGTTNIVVNYDGVPASTGLRIATTTVSSSLKSLVFYSATGIKSETVLMTFPVGTAVNADEFEFYTAADADGDRYPLYFKSVINEDGTVSLVTRKAYYKKGKDASGETSFDGNYTKDDTTIGWADTRNLSSVVSVEDMADSIFVVNGQGQHLRTPAQGGEHTFKGLSLILEDGGVLMTKGGENKTDPVSYTIQNLVGNGGTIQFNAFNNVQTIAGNASIVRNSLLTISLSPDGQKAVVSSKLTGDETTTLQINARTSAGDKGQELEISDADEFYGTIKSNDSPEPFILKLTGGLGGAIASLPVSTTKVLVNYEVLGDAGLRIATTEVPTSIKTAVTFYTDRVFADGAVLMTFPEGTVVDPAEFNVYRSNAIDGTVNRFARLATVVNADGTISLVKSSYGTVISFR